MKNVLKQLFFGVLRLTKPVIVFLLFRDLEKSKTDAQGFDSRQFSEMISEFNFLHRLFFVSFFKRAQYLAEDIKRIKSLKGPVVFVMKNKGQLEYRFFNHLFLKEKLAFVRFANSCHTLIWRPFSEAWQLVKKWLWHFYAGTDALQSDSETNIKKTLQAGERVLINLSISRDYLFGLVRTDPKKSLEPLVAVQKQMQAPIQIVTWQFFFDKHPERTDQSYFDLMFGERSRPGGIRKAFLFLMNYRRRPHVKIGEPINVQEIVSGGKEGQESQLLLEKIEDALSIEHARVTGPALKSKESTISDIMDDSEFQNVLQQLANQEEDEKTVQKRARRYLQEIAADVSYSTVQFFHVTLRYLWNRIFDGVIIKHQELAKIRALAGKNPIVLVPMHRSHIDYLLISDLFYEHNITFPYVCAGINLNFWPAGSIIRKGGGFFIRRRFDGNKVYKETFYAYLKHLLKERHCVEFFIEGTRSRTGKMMPPKMGVLSMIVRAFQEGAFEDLHFVPIAINYDTIPEEKAYEKEGEGAEKQSENAKELAKARSAFSKRYGKVYIEFAEPFSIKSYFENETAQSSERVQVEGLAKELTYQMNKVAIVTPMALLSLAMLSLKKNTFSLNQLLARVHHLKDYLDFKDAVFSDLLDYSEDYAFNQAIKQLLDKGVIKEVESFEGRFFQLDARKRGNLDFYKNNILHFFASLTSFLKALNTLPAGKNFLPEDLCQPFGVVQELLQREFTFSSRRELADHIKRVCDFGVKMGWLKKEDERYQATASIAQAQKDYGALFDNFFEAELLTLKFLAGKRGQEIEKKASIRELLSKGKPLYLTDAVSFPEALSKFNAENAFKLFSDLGILTKSESKNAEHSAEMLKVCDDEVLFSTWMQKLAELLAESEAVGASVQSEKNSQEAQSLH